MSFVHESNGRRLSTALIVAAVWAALIALGIGLNASPWVLGPLALVTLPAIWDLLRDPKVRVTLDDTALSWQAGRRDGHVPLARIRLARFDTLWDFSVRLTLEMTDGARLRLPPDCTPPHRAFESQLQQRGVATVRHHFVPRRDP
ncbi:hypothetical protein LA6_003601 [Marinibacterium anthonyi]|nr:hypothetical protein LA6_003601 [Marinibacterium anthonyi]